MLDVTLDIRLTLAGPVMTQATEPGAAGFDTACARTPDRRHFVLPGTLIKGRLRAAWRDLARAAPGDFLPDIPGWLGEASGNDERDALPVEPRRGRIRVTDFTCAASEHSAARCRIQVDEHRGSVVAGALQVIETPFGPGQTAEFRGTIGYLAADEAEAARIRHTVAAGLRWAPAYGGLQSLGFGRLLSVDVAPTERRLPVAVAELTETDVVTLLLRFDSPFCVARLQPDGNLFESDEVIPGGALKGCLARTWRMALGLAPDGPIDHKIGDLDREHAELAAQFHLLGFSHAFPAADPDPKGALRRPVYPPRSLVKALREGRDELRDIAACEQPVLLFGAAPAFSVDWKSSTEMRRDLFGWPRLRRELRVRTAIDPDKGKAADSQLFAYEMVVPDGRPWLARVDLTGVPLEQRRAVAGQLAGVLALGLRGLGKTDAHAAVEVRSGESVQDVVEDGRHSGSVVIVTLQSPAILCDLRRLNEQSGDAELHAAYAAAWDGLSGGTLRLERFYAAQSLAGGRYLHRRFRGAGAYEPWLLTEAGSVFVLAKTGDATPCVNEWRRRGLPLPGWAVEAFAGDGLRGDDWRRCPYQRENGYGSVAIDLAVHRDLRPADDEMTPIHDLNAAPEART